MISILFNILPILNNSCLKYLDIPLYQIARSLTIVYTIILSYLISHVLPSSKQFFYCMLVVIGYVSVFITEGVYEICLEYIRWLYYTVLYYVYMLCGLDTIGSIYNTLSNTSVLGSYNYSIVLGLLYGLSSSFILATYTMSIQMISLRSSSITVNTYMNIIGSILLGLYILYSGEIYTIVELKLFYLNEFRNWVVLTSCIGFLLGIITSLQIKYTTAVMHNMIGTSKAVVQTVLSCLLDRKRPTINYIVGLFLVLSGCSLYANSRYKMKDST